LKYSEQHSGIQIGTTLEEHHQGTNRAEHGLLKFENAQSPQRLIAMEQ
jgi:hypothetical protein